MLGGGPAAGAAFPPSDGHRVRPLPDSTPCLPFSGGAASRALRPRGPIPLEPQHWPAPRGIRPRSAPARQEPRGIRTGQ